MKKMCSCVVPFVWLRCAPMSCVGSSWVSRVSPHLPGHVADRCGKYWHLGCLFVDFSKGWVCMHAGGRIERLMQVLMARRGFWPGLDARLAAAWLTFRTVPDLKKNKPQLHKFSHVLSQRFASFIFHAHIVVCLMHVRR